MTDHEQFEAAMSAYCDPAKVEETFYREGDDYEAYATLFAWYAWQAARATPADHSRDSVIEECCAAIKAEDDRMADEDYMLDSDDCIRVCRALKSQQDAAIESQRSEGESS